MNLDIDRIREMLYESLMGNKRMLRNVKSKDLTPKCDLLKLSKERSVFRRFFNMIFYKKLGYLFLLLFTLVYGCGGGDGNGGDARVSWGSGLVSCILSHCYSTVKGDRFIF